jgi:UDP-N-acetylglucosamine transferase subunit ALG13
MDEFQEQVAKAQALIMHAGAGSIIHAVRSGKVPVVIPRQAAFGEHVDDHQVEFANQVRDTGKVVVCDRVQELLVAVDAARELQQTRTAAKSEPALVGMIRTVLSQSIESVRLSQSQRHENDKICMTRGI